MPNVFRLAYVELKTRSLDAACRYYDRVVGATTIERSVDTAYLSLGLDHYNIGLRRAEHAGLGAIGLQLSAGVETGALMRRIEGAGLTAGLMSDARPGVPVIIEVTGLGGHTFHLLPTMATTSMGFSGRGIEPVRLGHVAILSPEAPRIVSFLTDVLGFHATDWFDDVVTFVTCNRDHHVLNVIQAPIATMHHLAFELSGRDHHVRAADHLARAGIETVWGPSRHTAGHNIASYHHGADRALIELYSELDVFLPDVSWCEPRSWHADLPQRPKRWPIDETSKWRTRFEFDFMTAALGKV